MAYSKAKEQTPRILWFAMLMSHFMYVAIPYMTEFQGEAQQTDPQVMLYAFAGIALMEVAAIPILRRALFFGKLDSLDEDQVSGSYFTMFIVSLAIAESITIYGFVLAFLTNDTIYVWPFAGVGIATTIVLFPNVKKAYLAWEQAN